MLRAQGKPIAAIALSATVYPKDKQAALAAGYDRFLEKPVDPDHLIATVLNLLPQPHQFDYSLEQFN